MPAGIGAFTAQTEQGPIEGSAAFIEYEDRIYQLIGYSRADNWAGHRDSVNASVRSFAALADRRAIDVEPMRLDVIRVERSGSLRRIYNTYWQGTTPPVPVEEIALINQLEPDSRIGAGTRVKMVR